jgi:hypothetical protein
MTEQLVFYTVEIPYYEVNRDDSIMPAGYPTGCFRLKENALAAAKAFLLMPERTNWTTYEDHYADKYEERPVASSAEISEREDHITLFMNLERRYIDDTNTTVQTVIDGKTWERTEHERTYGPWKPVPVKNSKGFLMLDCFKDKLEITAFVYKHTLTFND